MPADQQHGDHRAVRLALAVAGGAAATTLVSPLTSWPASPARDHLTADITTDGEGRAVIGPAVEPSDM